MQTKLNTRQQAVLHHILSVGRSQVNDLSSRFDVTEQTIRSDLNKLCGLKLLERIYGGAKSVRDTSLEGNENISYRSRLHLSNEGKKKIALTTGQLILDNSSLFINIGTTTECVAEQLKNKQGLLVVTNNLNITNTLRGNDSIKVMVAGGLVRSDDGGIVGEATINFMDQFRLDFAVIGISAIDLEGNLLDFDFRETVVNKTIIKNARCVILVADGDKFERKAPVMLGNLSDVDIFVTDKKPPSTFIHLCERNNTKIYVA